jgi:tetratricopeptide (TPR) repeat protein
VSKAIFLSYASQDADAARRICDALRAIGLEVGSDQSDLGGGDAWDQSIRAQIKECALFVPLISPNTNARAEAYFRLEWKLAADRMQLMADNKPFLFPVLLDGLAESDALVPDRFRERQWTKLPDDEAHAAFARRLEKVLASPALTTPAPARPGILQPPSAPRRRWLAGGIALAGVGGLAALVTWRPWSRTEADPGAAAGTARRDPQVVRALQVVEALDPAVADVELAEDLVKTVLAARPTDPDATLAMARIQVYFLLRGFDRTEGRFVEAARYAERALSLNPEDPEAKVALATYLYNRNVELPRAKALLDGAIASRPNEPRYYRIRDNVLANTPGVSPADLIAAAKATAERFPRDALVQYELARHYRNTNFLEEAEQYLDRAIELVRSPTRQSSARASSSLPMGTLPP